MSILSSDLELRLGYLRLRWRRRWREGEDRNGRGEGARGGFSAAKGTIVAAAASQEGQLPLLSRCSWRSNWAWQALAQLSPSLPPLCPLLVHHVISLSAYQDSTQELWLSQISSLLRYQSALTGQSFIASGFAEYVWSWLKWSKEGWTVPKCDWNGCLSLEGSSQPPQLSPLPNNHQYIQRPATHGKTAPTVTQLFR